MSKLGDLSLKPWTELELEVWVWYLAIEMKEAFTCSFAQHGCIVFAAPKSNGSPSPAGLAVYGGYFWEGTAIS